MNISDIDWVTQPKNRNTSRVANRTATNKLEALLLSKLDSVDCQLFKPSIDDVLGLGRRAAVSAHASNITTRARISEALGEQVRREWEIGGERQLFFLTFAPDEWLISSVVPVTRLKAMRAKLSRFLKELDVTAIGFFELCVFLNHPLGTDERLYGWHVDAIAVPADIAAFKNRARRLKKKLGRNSLGRFVFDRRPIKREMWDVTYTSAYAMKNSASAKRATPENGRPTRFKLRNAPCPAHDAIRVAEIQSYFDVRDLVVTRGGAGWRWRQRLFEGFDAIFKCRVSSILRPTELDKMWRSISPTKCRPRVQR